MADKNPADLAVWRAIVDAICDRDIGFYPRVTGKKGIESLKTRPMQEELEDACEGWEGLSDTGIDMAISLARQSLDEVKEQTEYQDQKVGRLLTVATILGALSGILFGRFIDAYPLRPTLEHRDFELVVVLICYVSFAAFVLCVLFGALVTFHATRTRFKYKTAAEEAAAENDASDSRLFYKPILRVRPSAWAKSFVVAQTTGSEERLVLNPALSQLYFRDLVTETYLIAAKTADKIRYLEAAQRLLSWALRCLLAWLVALAAVSLFSPTAPAAKPTKVELVQSVTAARETIVRLSQPQPLLVEASIKREPALPAAPDADIKKKGGQ